MQPNPFQPPGAAGGGGGGAGRFVAKAAIGGVIGGVLSAIPVLGALNCCFCLLNMSGAAIGLSMYLKAHPEENISNGDAATSGAISGAVAGLVAGIVGLVKSLLTNPAAIAEAMRQVPAELRPMVTWVVAGGGVLGVIIAPLIYAGFGALGGFLSMQLFFKSRLLKR
jgi:hypothetical protein